jgi:hypothetical protein
MQQWLMVDSEDAADRLPNDVCKSLINWTITQYCRNRESRFGEDSDYFLTVAEQRDYAEPNNFSKPRKFYYYNPDTGSQVILDYVDKDEFDRLYPGSVLYSDSGPGSIPGLDTTDLLGLPESYTLYDGVVMLGPVPDREITILRDYWIHPPDLVNDEDWNRMTAAADDYVLMKSLAGAAIFGIEDERIPMWEKVAAKLEAEIDNEDARRKQVGRIPRSQEPG